MCGQKSVIRELFMYGRERAAEIGYENVFDYSLGNPSVAPPESFTKEMIRLLNECEPVSLHGYSPTLGIDSAREAVAKSLNPAKTLVPAQYGQPTPLALLFTVACHSCPHFPSHQIFLLLLEVIFSGCKSLGFFS